MDTLNPKLNRIISNQDRMIKVLEKIAGLMVKQDKKEETDAHAEERSSYLVDKYGERCTREVAGTILGCSKTTISRLCKSGELKTINHRIEVRSILRYLEKEEASQTAIFEEEQKIPVSTGEQFDPKLIEAINAAFNRHK